MGRELVKELIWLNNIKRLNSWNKVVFFIHLGLLFTSDLYNYVNGVWDIFPSQYYVFLNHLISFPILGFFIFFNAFELKNKDVSLGRYRRIFVVNILAFLPMMLIYYYWDLVDYASSGIMMVYISAAGFLFRFSKKEVIYFTLYLSAIYFGMIFFVQTAYKLNPSLYLNGIAILVLYYFFTNILYKSEYKLYESKFDIEKKNRSLKDLNQSLNSSKKRIELQNIGLKEQNKSLDNFAKIVAHDIKAPLKMIENFAGVLSNKYQEKIEENDQPLFDYIADGSQNLIGIVDALYGFTKISTSSTLEFEKIDLNFTIKRSLALMGPEFEKHRIQIFFEQDFPNVLGVEELIQNVFLNLFSNAVKFRGEDIPSTLKITHQISKKNSLEICVADNGIGIPKPSQKEVFQLFKKLNVSDTYEGFGIGLATCKTIIQKHGGKIWISSPYQRGTSVHFTLPIFTEKDKNKSEDQKTLKVEV